MYVTRRYGMRKSFRALKKIKYNNSIWNNKDENISKIYTYNNVYSYKHFVERLPKCKTNVGWKSSVQNYMINSITKMYSDYLSMKEHILPKPVSSHEITIYERGKERIITPIHVKDRLLQKIICDYALTPILTPKLIYDNGASLEGKGVQFSRQRLNKHLIQAIKEYGSDFYVLSFDFKSYFDSIPHSTCRMMLARYIEDKDIVEMAMEMIKSPHNAKILKIKDKKKKDEELLKLNNDEYKGICLGSQVSQIMALIVASDLDHYIKDVAKRKYYDRYMDDGDIFGKTKEELVELLEEMKKVCDVLGLVLNEKKTRISKISSGFTFLKVRYRVTDSKKIVKKMARRGITKMRQKLKKFRNKVDKHEMTLDNVYDSFQSWLEHSKIANSYNTVKSMLRLYIELFDGYRITKAWKNKQRRNKNVLQADKWAKYRWGCVA